MNNHNYTKKELNEADDKQLSFLVGVNLVNTSENILQFPFELLKNKRKGWGRNHDISVYKLFAAFQCIVTAVELLLKARISLVDYSLLFKNKVNVSREALINGEFHSVNFDRCIEIIEKNTGEKVPERLKKRVESIRLIRNKITHYYIDVSNEMFLNYIAFGLDVFIDYYRNSIKELIYDSYDRTEGFEEELSDFSEFVKIRVDAYKESTELGKYSVPGNPECPVCYTWNIIKYDNGKEKCLFCGYENIEEGET